MIFDYCSSQQIREVMQTLYLLAVTVHFENNFYQFEWFLVSFIIFVGCLFTWYFLFYRHTIIISSLLLSQNVNHGNEINTEWISAYCGQMRGMCKSVKSNCSRIPAEAVVCLRHDYLVQQKSAADREHSNIISKLLCSQPTHSATSLTEPTLPYVVIYFCYFLAFVLFLIVFIKFYLFDV